MGATSWLVVGMQHGDAVIYIKGGSDPCQDMQPLVQTHDECGYRQWLVG